MTVRRFLISALAITAAVTAAPAGHPVDKRQGVPTFTPIAAATQTAVIPVASSSVLTKTETVTSTQTQVLYPRTSSESEDSDHIGITYEDDGTETFSYSFGSDVFEGCLGPNCPQPGNPVIDHAVPVVQPALPDGQPEVPGIQPVVPVVVPSVPGIQAEVPGIQPAVPVVEPEVPVSEGSSSGESKGYQGFESSGRLALPGISWDVFRADRSCKTKEQIHDDLSRFEGSYSLLRTYGTECDQVAHVYSWSKSSNMKLFLGIYNPEDVQGEAQRIIDGVNGDWSKVDTISVGNEQVNFGKIKAERAVSALKQARQIFRKAGYQGPVVFVDTSAAVIEHPELCNESDYCAINAHAFFDASVSAKEAGTWLTKTINNVKSKISGGKRIVVCETGWPYKGIANGRAVPAMPQQQAAIAAIKEVFSSNPHDLILFSGYNSPWKPEEAATFYAEPYWGINGAKSSSN
ncbi:Cell surface mannoprotein mp65 [Fusarium torreyae]|uniref:Cell surface mannoprotein mp65 n=1 Tax=Fusarium torreyae TaxID=1237075 RepID=A0A9W8V923_9HYPO|nr:Cell surface mannoprotein mp65 [Fusarium torreyae]